MTSNKYHIFCVIHRLRYVFLNTKEEYYKHLQILYCHNYWAVCGNNADISDYTKRNSVFCDVAFKWHTCKYACPC
jgi:hypothetical protein